MTDFYFKVFLSLLTVLDKQILMARSTTCPPQSLIAPCECSQLDLTVIYCGGHESIDLLSIFRDISNHFHPKRAHFGIFFLNNTSIKSLPAFVFQNTTFTQLYFDGSIQLEYIDRNAFVGTETTIEYVNAWHTNLLSYRSPNQNDAFSALTNLKRLDIADQMYCPNHYTIKPCYCRVESSAIGSHDISKRNAYNIHCNTSEPYFIRQIFQRLTIEEPECGTHFDSLYIDNHLWTNDTDIPEDAFAGVTFSAINIQTCDDCRHYRLYIHPKAFGKTRLSVQSLSFSTNIMSKTTQYSDTFIAVNSLSNLRNITINVGFKSLDSYSFRANNWSKSGQINLKSISIKGGILRHIESYAFFTLSNLNLIDLSQNNISRIDRHAFAFRDPSSALLLIDLRDNAIHSQTFEFGAFSYMQRPVELILATHETHCWPLFQYLSEDIFAPLLACNTQNIIQLGPCALECDCNMKWLVDAPQHWRLQVRGGQDLRVAHVLCTNGRSLFEMKSEEFGDCSSQCDQNALHINIHQRIVCKNNITNN